MSNSTEEIAVTGDGYVIKKGNTYYHARGTEVKVVEVHPASSYKRMVQVTKLGLVSADSLFKSENSKAIDIYY